MEKNLKENVHLHAHTHMQLNYTLYTRIIVRQLYFIKMLKSSETEMLRDTETQTEAE